MTRLLEKATARTRELPAEDQDSVAVAMLPWQTRAAIREGLEQAPRAIRFRFRNRYFGNDTACEGSFHAAARDDLAAILQYLDERSQHGAQTLKRAIRKTIEFIGEFQRAARLR